MSTRFEIPFSIDSELQNVRLLELPAQLEDIITRKESSSLYLKSTKTEAGNVVLCSDTQTFAIREVQSSNSVYLIQDDQHSGLSATALCKSFLECTLARPNVEDYVTSTLSCYRSTHLAGDEIFQEADRITLLDLINDCPASKGELESTLVDLCVFEHEDTLVRPDAAALSVAWAQILSLSNMGVIDLTGTIRSTEVIPYTREFRIPDELIAAIVTRLYTGADAKTTILSWTGTILLQSKDAGGLAEGALLREWRNILPEQWQKEVSVDLLKHTSTRGSDGRIQAILSRESKEQKTMHKWHERLKK